MNNNFEEKYLPDTLIDTVKVSKQVSNDYLFNGELAQASRQLLTAMKKVFVRVFRVYDVLDWLESKVSKCYRSS